MTIQTNTQKADTSALYGLTEAERLEARDVARQNVIRRYGDKPRRDQFRDSATADYPRYVITAAAIMLTLVFIAAAAISTFRLYAAGRDFFMQSLPIVWQAKVVGLATAIMAEFLVITATASATILFKGWARLLAVVPILIGLLVAFVGNHTVTQATTLWGWLDTFAPPLAVLSVGVMGERVLLLTLRQRWANEKAYQQALASWQAATADPEASPHWRSAYTNALRQKLVEVNSRGRGKSERQAIMQHMTLADWRALVMRELQADNWFDAPESESVTHQDALQAVLSTGGGKTAVPLAEAPAGAILMSGNGHGGGRH